MTGFDKAVTRRTVDAYRFTVTGSGIPAVDGRKLVVTLINEGHGDLIRIREAGRSTGGLRIPSGLGA
jgi:hypothetical protein